MTGCSIFSNSSIILTRLWASIGVTRAYSSRPFLCALVDTHFKYKQPAYLSFHGYQSVLLFAAEPSVADELSDKPSSSWRRRWLGELSPEQSISWTLNFGVCILVCVWTWSAGRLNELSDSCKSFSRVHYHCSTLSLEGAAGLLL